MDHTELVKDTGVLMEHLRLTLHSKSWSESFFVQGMPRSAELSAVLLLLRQSCAEGGRKEEICILFNKRSTRVRQPGDLCFPGGSVTPRGDYYLSRLLALRPLPLGRWPYWKKWRDRRRKEARRLALLFATSIRESFEEMRLNPFRVCFLGPLPPEELQMFKRVIYPMVGWIRGGRRHFIPNREVERIVSIPLLELLNRDNYVSYRLQFEGDDRGVHREFPGFRHQSGEGPEILWGATYRIVVLFLRLAFGFYPPQTSSLPVVSGRLDINYLNGSVAPTGQ